MGVTIETVVKSDEGLIKYLTVKKNISLGIIDSNEEYGLGNHYCMKVQMTEGDEWRVSLEGGVKMIGLAKTIGRLIGLLINAGIIERDQVEWILEPLKDKTESEEDSK